MVTHSKAHLNLGIMATSNPWESLKMKNRQLAHFGSTPWWAMLLGTVMLVSCSAPITPEKASNVPLPAAESSDTQNTAVTPPDQAELSSTARASGPTDLKQALPQPATAAQAKPQLIKRAEITLRVEKVEAAVKAVTQVIEDQQGEVVGLRDQVPPNDSLRHVATMELRVPQVQLDQTLEQLASLGKMQSRDLKTQDVSNQLVDFQSRLRNLRKSEEVVLKIMDRSGSIADVLKVAQELKTIRESIEQLDGQLKNLQTQVAYSTVQVTLESAIAPSLQTPSAGDQLQDSWSESTNSLVTVTISLLGIGLWLIAFSPYLLVLLILFWLLRRVLNRHMQGISATNPLLTTPSDDQSSSSTDA